MLSMAIIPSHDCDLQAKVVDFVAPNGGLYIPKLQVVSPMECVPTLLT